MTYADQENSIYGGKPVELYTFIREGLIWRYATGDDDQILAGFTYKAVPIDRGAIEQSADTVRNAISLKCAASLGVLDAFMVGVPSGVTTLEIVGFHYGINEYVNKWRGRILNVKFQQREADIKCEPIFTSLLRPVLRRFYQTTCPHVLYGAGCKAARGSFAVTGELAGSNGSNIQSALFAAKPDGWFTGGYIDYSPNDGEVQRRFVLAHVGDTVSTSIPFVAIPGNAIITAYPGCDHSLITCHNKFGNEDNYGGQPFYPAKNPFGGSQVF